MKGSCNNTSIHQTLLQFGEELSGNHSACGTFSENSSSNGIVLWSAAAFAIFTNHQY
jgi:hypothetical protein